MSNMCRSYSRSKLGLEAPDNRKAFYAGWRAGTGALLAENTIIKRERNALRDLLREARANLYDMCDAAIVYRIDEELAKCKEVL